MARRRSNGGQGGGNPVRRHATTAGVTLAGTGALLLPWMLSQGDKVADMRTEVVAVREANAALQSRTAGIEAAQKATAETMWPRIAALEKEGAAGSSLMTEVKDRLNRVDAKLEKLDDSLRAIAERK